MRGQSEGGRAERGRRASQREGTNRGGAKHAREAFRAAHKRLFGEKVAYFRDLRHQISAAQGTAPAKATDPKWAAFVVGSILFSAWLWHDQAFDQFFKGVVTKLTKAEPPQLDLIQWLQEDVLTSAGGHWTAEWFSGLLSQHEPGRSAYLQQCWERMFGVLRQTLPVGVRYMDPEVVFKKLGCAMEAVAKHQEWIEPAKPAKAHEKLQFKPNWRSVLKPRTVSALMVGGPPSYSERKIPEDDAQFQLLRCVDLCAHGPGNVVAFDADELLRLGHLPGDRQFRGKTVVEVLVMPQYVANLEITRDLAELAVSYLFHGDDTVKFKSVSRKLGLLVEQEASGARGGAAGDLAYSVSGARICLLYTSPSPRD